MTTLALGTVQFGLPYGVANQTGQVSAAEIGDILSTARAAGIDTLDTAIAYGESETRLGAQGMRGWEVVTKLPPLPSECADVAAWVDSNLAGSLARLGLPRIKALLLHRSQDLLGPRGDLLHRALVRCRDAGQVGQIGISVYSPQDVDAVRQRHAIDIVQAPFNVVDRRLATSGTLARLAEQGVEVHVRSAFLQGLLLMNPGDRPPRFGHWRGLWDTWSDWLAASRQTPLEACLGFALSQSGIARVVVGVDGVNHLRQIVAASRVAAVAPPAGLVSDDPQLINPSNWHSS